MSWTDLRLWGRDALLFRDGRPFHSDLGALSARSLPLPLPGTLAGIFRTRVGGDWAAMSDLERKAKAAEVLQVAHQGPLLEHWSPGGTDGEIAFCAPADAFCYLDNAGTAVVVGMTPDESGSGGCDLPPGLAPLRLRRDVQEKPASGYRYWPRPVMERWLLDPGQVSTVERLSGPEQESRVHVGIDVGAQKAKDGLLYSTDSLSFGNEWSLRARVKSDHAPTGLYPCGGEQRLAQVEEAEGTWPACPPDLAAALGGGDLVRMVLATPAVFAGGWRPGWVDETTLEGVPPDIPVRLKLVAAAVPRREAVSGWDFQARGPKAVRWMVPAGAAYFFEKVSGDLTALAGDGWLAPVSDADQDRLDGYGLALWGRWARS
jgi:CRISPR-associated protein Cmr3